MKITKKQIFIITSFATILFLLMFSALIAPLFIVDESWNFMNIYKMVNGGLLYKDNNVIDMPIFFIIGKKLFQLFGSNIVTFRMYNIGIFFIKFLLIYFILKKMGVNKINAIAYIFLYLAFDIQLIYSSANYNQLSMIFVLLGILGFVTLKNKKYYNLFQGLIIFCVFFTKQTYGIYYALAIVSFEISENGFFCKKFWKNQFMKGISFLILTLFSIAAILNKGIFLDFINMCFGSVIEFGSKNFVMEWESQLNFVPLIIMVIGYYFISKMNKSNIELNKNNKFITYIALFMTLNVYPIFNDYHIKMNYVFYFLMFVTYIDVLVVQEIYEDLTKSIVIITLIITIFIFVQELYLLKMILDDDYMLFEKQNAFYGTYLDAEEYKKMETVKKYIKEREKEGINVIIPEYNASLYMVQLNKNNRQFDMLLQGNLGYDGINKSIEEISKMKNTEFLIFTNDDEHHYQTPQEIIDYIKQNFEKKEELTDYTIYKSN